MKRYKELPIWQQMALMLIVFISGVSAFNKTYAGSIVDQLASKNAAIMNSKLPLRLNGVIEISELQHSGFEELTYIYRYFKYTKEELGADINYLIALTKESAIEEFCTSKDSRLLLDKGLKINCVFYDKYNRVIAKAKVTSSMCK